jgi:hypothetical protein
VLREEGLCRFAFLWSEAEVMLAGKDVGY